MRPAALRRLPAPALAASVLSLMSACEGDKADEGLVCGEGTVEDAGTCVPAD